MVGLLSSQTCQFSFQQPNRSLLQWHQLSDPMQIEWKILYFSRSFTFPALQIGSVGKHLGIWVQGAGQARPVSVCARRWVRGLWSPWGRHCLNRGICLGSPIPTEVGPGSQVGFLVGATGGKPDHIYSGEVWHCRVRWSGQHWRGGVGVKGLRGKLGLIDPVMLSHGWQAGRQLGLCPFPLQPQLKLRLSGLCLVIIGLQPATVARAAGSSQSWGSTFPISI